MIEEGSLPEPANAAEHARALFDRSFDAAYDFCLRLLLNPQAAVAAAEEAIARSASVLGSSREPAEIRVYLFREVLRAAADHSQQAARPFADPTSLGLDRLDPERLLSPQAPQFDEWTATVWEVLSRLTLEEYAFLDLHLRQGLDLPELAAVYGVKPSSIGKKLERLARETRRNIAALATARQATAGCESLRQALLSLPLRATMARVRQIVEAHCKTCPSCIAFQQRLPPPLDLFQGTAVVAPPADVKERVWQRLSTAMAETPVAAPAAATPLPPVEAERPAKGLGLSRRLAQLRESLANGWSRLTSGKSPLLPLAAALFVIGTAGGIAWGTGMFDGSGGSAPPASPTPTRTQAATSTVTATASPSPTKAPTATTTEEPSPTPEPTATPSPTVAPPTAAPVATDTPLPPASPSPPATTPVPSPTEGTPAVASPTP